eukprot:TRINITY_DN15781_c0_g1_i1.p1 TRINITY_DN15781_c0_g1~~TRINITY_DN15781_c0_g1_i1.p1  ORF type:complete len:305 (+),score=24.03 TRINITY_DN15781_c0_g1_i1:22-915(+)
MDPRLSPVGIRASTNPEAHFVDSVREFNFFPRRSMAEIEDVGGGGKLGEVAADDPIRIQWGKEQLELKEKMILKDDVNWTLEHDKSNTIRYIGGVDISFVKDNETDACAALVVLSYPSLEVVYERYKFIQLKLPYIPGFLAFREVGFLMELIEELKETKPDLIPQLIFVDGNGYLHPRGFGLACHLGVLSGIPTIGVGKTLFFMDGIGIKSVKKTFAQSCRKAGDYCKLIGDSGTVWGAAFKSTEEAMNPIFISVGHRVSLDTAVKASIMCCKFRVPEPVRVADLRSRDWLRQNYKV